MGYNKRHGRGVEYASLDKYLYQSIWMREALEELATGSRQKDLVVELAKSDDSVALILVISGKRIRIERETLAIAFKCVFTEIEVITGYKTDRKMFLGIFDALMDDIKKFIEMRIGKFRTYIVVLDMIAGSASIRVVKENETYPGTALIESEENDAIKSLKIALMSLRRFRW